MSEKISSLVLRKRTELQMSQRDLAKAINVSPSTIARVEGDDTTTPSLETLKGLSQALHVDFFYLLSLTGQIDDEPELRVIQRAAAHMSQDDKAKMLNVFKAMFPDAFDKAGSDE